MNRIYSRGGSRYKVTGRRFHHYDVHVRCSCPRFSGHHWHHLGRRDTDRAAERLINEHAFQQTVAAT